MSDQQALTITRTVHVKPSAVYEAFTNATALREWWSDGAVANAREGGTFHVWWNAGYYVLGEYTTLKENELIAFDWLGSGEAEKTEVKVEIKAVGDNTQLTITHSSRGNSTEWSDQSKLFKEGWEDVLENLESVLGTGIDLRISRRPMLGIIVSQQIDEEIAKKIGVPITEGVQIGSAIEGMGAEAAGLTGGDVITRLADTPITSFSSFAQAVAPYHGGDTVEVEFYRGSEKHVVDMILSKRQLPEVPADSNELANQMQGIFDQVYGEIVEIVGSVSDEVASHHPADGEWNVKQILAHLILSERGTIDWMATLVSGNEKVNFPNNVNSQHNAVVATFPTTEALMGELRRVFDEEIAFIAGLEDDFVRSTRSYVRMGQTLLQTAYHPQGHHAQLQEAIEAASVKA